MWEGVAINVALLICFTFLLFPILWIFLMSFKSNADILSWPPKFIFTPTLDSYISVTVGALRARTVGAVSADFLGGFRNSLMISTVAVLVSLLLGVPAAYAMARYNFRFKEDIAFTFLSFRFAPELLVIIPIYLIFRKIGLYDTYLGLVWVYQLITMPMIIWIVRGYFEDIPIELEQASLLDGYSLWRSFLKVMVPLVRPGVAAAALLSAIYAWNNFVFALILGSSRVEPVTVAALKFITVEKMRYGEVAAAATISILPVLILSFYLQRHLVRGLTFGAVKK